jgi:hypothetical protein
MMAHHMIAKLMITVQYMQAWEKTAAVSTSTTIMRTYLQD